jgi:hypothetical protein
MGLFAEHVVIPRIDNATEADFESLLSDLCQEFQPVGPVEEFYVEEMAKSMWRMRRATISEKGSIRDAVCWANLDAPPLFPLSSGATDKRNILASAQKEISITGILSLATYAAVSPLLGLEQSSMAQGGERNGPIESKIDDSFLATLKYRRRMLDCDVELLMATEEEKREDFIAIRALPPDAIMNKILRYEKAAQKKYDWALQRLLQSQQRRQKAQE